MRLPPDGGGRPAARPGRAAVRAGQRSEGARGAAQGRARRRPAAAPRPGATAARGAARWPGRSGHGEARRQREGAAQRRGVLGDLGALGGDEQAHAGVARGVRRRRNRASAAARRRSGSGGAGFKRGWGWEGRGERGEAHRRLDLSGRRPRGEFDGEGEARRGCQWWPAVAGSIRSG